MRSGYALLLGALPFACALDTSGSLTDDGGGSTTSPGPGGSSVGAGEGGEDAPSSSGSAGAPPTSEGSCVDGIDGDDNGLVDCADPGCASHACVPAHPGALAYVLRNQASCDAPLAARPLAACEGGCNCNANGGTCRVDVSYYTASGCQTGDFYGYAQSPMGCYDNDPDGARSWRGSATPRNDASCTPASPTVTASTLAACAIEAPGSCAGTDACLPVASESWCALLAGDVACTAPYERAGIYFDDAGSASCACSCNAGPQTCSGGSVYVDSFTDGCFAGATLSMDGNCKSAGDTEAWWLPDAEGQVSCTAAIAPVGSPPVVTLCCLPVTE